jgi:aspartate/methionine/tyrosine aminotransferase
MNRIPNRRERRKAMKYHGALKLKSKLQFSQWVEAVRVSIKNGKDIFNSNQGAMERSIAEQLEKKEIQMIENWKESGHTSTEIKKLREAYATLTVCYRPTWHTDKKVARNIIKEVNKYRAERVHG